MRFLVIAAIAALGACSPPQQESAEPALPSVQPQPETFAADAWLGKWIGVEGNTLDIASANGAPGLYAITEGTLDGPKTYTGNAEGDGIGFTDGDRRLTLRAGTGDETGLKYLAGKTNCLVSESGRGFCR